MEEEMDKKEDKKDAQTKKDTHNENKVHLHSSKHKKKFATSKLFLYIIFILGFLALLNLFFTLNISSKIGGKIAEIEEKTRPAKIQIISLVNPQCKECFDIKPVVDEIKSKNVEVLREDTLDFSSGQGTKLINQYHINRIPTVILGGEINKTNFKGYRRDDSVLIYDAVEAPYVDTSKNEIRGLVEATILFHPECDNCFNLEPILESLKEINVKIIEEEKISAIDPKGIQLIQKYNITKLPSLILSKEVSLYEQIAAEWDKLGSIEEDGNYIFREIFPPYYDFSEKRVVGIVNVVYLTDNSCESCYNVSLHKPILSRFGIEPNSEKHVDVGSNEGKQLIKKYGIVLVPTIILSKDADYYESLKIVWESVGKVADDGSYIFTALQQMRSTYKNLTSGMEVNYSLTQS